MIVVASCGHYSDDERIYYKQIHTLKQISDKIEYFTYNKLDYKISDRDVNHHHFNSNTYSQGSSNIPHISSILSFNKSASSALNNSPSLVIIS